MQRSVFAVARLGASFYRWRKTGAAAVSENRERMLAWAGAVVAAVYFGWLGMMLSYGATTFGMMFEGLGAEVPAPTRFLVAGST